MSPTENDRAGCYGRLADLALTIDGYQLDGLRLVVQSGFERHTTVVRLHGRGETGVGEDVNYEAGEQLAFQRDGSSLPLAGSYTLDELSRRLDTLELFTRPPRHAASRDYRRWAFESAALDLALRQHGRSLARAIGVEPRPLRFVCSTGLGSPPSVAPLSRRLAFDSLLRFKLDATSSWTDELARAIAAVCVVETIDLKGAYHDTPVDQSADLALYRRVAEIFPAAWLEDPVWNAVTEPVLQEHRARITWDAPIHSVADVEGLPFAPRMLNIKPSRSGSLRRLFELYRYCNERGIGCYGGGQFELGPGRGQIQCLAALFHPDAPNDVAPGGYNLAELPQILPRSPIEPPADEPGFGWPWSTQ